MRLFEEQRNNIYPEIPNDFVVLEYIQSSGDQYIDTGFKPNNLTTMEAIAAFNQSYIVGCCRWSGSPAYDTFGMYSISGGANSLVSYFGRYSDDKLLFSDNYVSNTKIKWILSPTKVKINSVDDNSYNIDEDINQDTYQSNYNLWLFGFNNQGSKLVQNANGKIYSCKLWDNGTLVRDFIPVQNTTSNEIGMYDLVHRKFYTNAGTGAFTAGPIIKRIDYIETSGTQYINTGMNSTNFDDLTLDYAYSSYTTEAVTLLGGWDQSDNKRLVLQRYASTNYYNVLVDLTSLFQTKALDTNRHIFNYNSTNGTVSIDDDKETVSATSFTTSLTLGCLHSSSSGMENYGKGKFYEFVLKKDGSKVMDLIPILYGSTYAMYDSVGRKVYTNSGTGNFTGGSLVKPANRIRVAYCDPFSSDFERLDYIQSNGSQYIDTGMTGNLNTSFEIKFAMTQVSQQGVLFGSRTSATSNVISVIAPGAYDSNLNNVVVDFGNYTVTRLNSNHDMTIDDVIVVYNSKDSRYIKNLTTGTQYTASTTYSTSFTTPTNLYIAHKTSGFASSHYNFIGKIYYCKIWDDGTLVRNFVPVHQKSTGKNGMYDLVNNVFYPSVTSTNFIAGNTLGKVRLGFSESLPKVPGYTWKEYLQSSGTQYIDTDITPNQDTSVELSMNALIASGNQDFFGASSSSDDYSFGFYDGGSTTWDNYNDDICVYSGHISGDMIVKKTKNVLTVTGSYPMSYTHSTSTFTSGTTLYLFTRKKVSTTYRPATMKCYYFKIWDDDTLVRHFVPALRESDNVLGMYDIVNNVFYTNQGTGSFTSN